MARHWRVYRRARLWGSLRGLYCPIHSSAAWDDAYDRPSARARLSRRRRCDGLCLCRWQEYPSALCVRAVCAGRRDERNRRRHGAVDARTASGRATGAGTHLADGHGAKMRSSLFTHDPRFGNGWLYGVWAFTLNGVLYVEHDGWTLPAFRSDMKLFPDEKLGLFVAFNGDNTGNAVSETPREFIDHYFPKDPFVSPVVLPGLAHAPRVVGAYHTTRTSYTTMEKIRWLMEPYLRVSALPDGKLVASDGSARATYVEVNPLVFSRVEADSKLPSTLIFQADERGEIRYVFSSGITARERFAWLKTRSCTCS